MHRKRRLPCSARRLRVVRLILATIFPRVGRTVPLSVSRGIVIKGAGAASSHLQLLATRFRRKGCKNGKRALITEMALERQVRAKIAAKRDPQQEREAQEWIESILGRKFNAPFEDYLRDGQVLCELMNKIKPGSINKINTSGGEFKMMENINKFQEALKNYGVPDIDVFQTVELWEKKDIGQVITTLFALGRETYRHPEWKGPYLGPKPADECKRDFSEEQLKAGQTVIGLQAGSNKGATQAGQNIGASRKILLGK